MSTRKRRSIFDIFNEYLRDLDEWTERFREELIERPSWDHRACTIEPLRDIIVTPTEVVMTVDLPYAEENTIRVKSVDKETIHILARMKRKIRFDDFGITHYKGEFETLQCQTRIPVPVHMDRMKVKFEKGILEIRMPRRRQQEIPME